ncbi:MAG: MHS family MFS transporter [Bacteroidetes bacterium]|nr:MHS family MFS transporter [Bacteroidota bacterium]
MANTDFLKEYKIWNVIGASSAGTLIEWYDFYIFGSLAPIMSGLFFPKENPTAGLLSTLAIFATGFAVRPFGAIVFGRIGDVVGRKYAFLVTLLLMGGATTAIGLLPTYESIGLWAPAALVLLRLTQGLALGGEYGGAATYIAEHCPDEKRGFYTSFIQTTATLGLFVSLGVILSVRSTLGEDAFREWGWRIPFILSIVLVVFSYFIRMRLQESPLFSRMKAAGKTSTNPLKDAFANKGNWKIMALALFGATAGQGVVWYTGQFYALYYLQTVLKIHFMTANFIVAVALLLATPFFIVFGALSDTYGRKRIIMTGCLVAAVSYLPIYMGMEYFAQDPNNPNAVMLSALVFIQVIFVTMVYGPIAAYLVELFPTKIRYTSMSLPYHVGNGVFGGLVPLIGVAMVAQTGNNYAGLFYPIAIALMTFIVGTLFTKDTKEVKLWDELEAEKKV